MGPYPLNDSTNLLGPTTSLAGSSTCYTNYGTNIHTPVPIRKCYYDYTYNRDNFRRHSAHGQRHHRSVNDVCNSSFNTCNDPSCGSEREFHEHFASKISGCCSSRTELAQYFAEDLYGTTSRRPSSCCTSSDYCYQTDSTSLYGSRSSLSRNNSIKSANVTFRQKKLNKRQPSYSSLRAINTSRPNSQIGSLTSVFDRSRIYEDDNYITNGDRSKSEHQTSKDALNNELPEYACSPSPIRWSFLADSKSPTDTLEGKTTTNTSTSTSAQKTKEKDLRNKEHINAEHHEKSASGRYHRTQRTQSCIRGDENPSTSRKCCESPKPYETSTTVQFHQEGESYNNCCNNYIQCNTYLDQDLQITSEDIHQYLSKGNQEAGSVLNNAKTYPFQPSNALEFQYKNNFANNNNNAASNTLSSMEGAESLRSYDSRFRRNSSKETNLNQNVTTTETCVGACAASSCSSGTPLSPTNINLSSSTNNINIVFSSCLERNANEVKFINTAVGEVRERENGIRDTHHGGNYLPFTYPAYDYTNMSASSIFDKPLGIDELPKEFNSATETTGNTSSSQHSSSLQSPEPNRVSFESFDAASEHNLLSRQGSCQYSSTPRTPRSPDSIANSSTYSAAVNPAATSYSHPSTAQHVHYDYPTGTRQCISYEQQQPQQQQQQQQEQCSQSIYQAHHHHHHHHHHRYQQHNTESFKLSNAFKKVRKRARKYTDFLRKK
uniref:Uncharacterized protein n=1 Tax=Glossina morsitans morsitans TaxID=37546 RepID=A0A1B0GG35_GLOMM